MTQSGEIKKKKLVKKRQTETEISVERRDKIQKKASVRRHNMQGGDKSVKGRNLKGKEGTAPARQGQTFFSGRRTRRGGKRTVSPKEAMNTNAASEMSDQTEEMRSDRTSVMKGEIKLFLIRLCAMVVIVYVIFGIVFGVMPVRDDDMKPRISAGDVLVFYRFRTQYRVGDILIYKKEGRRYVGRVVAQAQDEVNISDDRRLIINGNIVAEPDIYFDTGEYEGGIDLPVTVPEGAFFVLSDYREGGKDSRLLGTVSKSEIVGKVITVIRRSGL